jgi:hypothetical protein
VQAANVEFADPAHDGRTRPGRRAPGRVRAFGPAAQRDGAAAELDLLVDLRDARRGLLELLLEPERRTPNR